MVGSYIISVKRHYPKGDKFSFVNILRQFAKSFWRGRGADRGIGVGGRVFTATESPPSPLSTASS
jgi:hypothetical protein